VHGRRTLRRFAAASLSTVFRTIAKEGRRDTLHRTAAFAFDLDLAIADEAFAEQFSARASVFGVV